MKEQHWHESAYDLFFGNHEDIKDIAVELGISRQTVSKYVKSCAAYNMEKQFRHKQSLQRQSNYKSEWYRSRKSIPDKVYDSLKLEHFEAVKVLSYEKYYESI